MTEHIRQRASPGGNGPPPEATGLHPEAMELHMGATEFHLAEIAGSLAQQPRQEHAPAPWLQVTWRGALTVRRRLATLTGTPDSTGAHAPVP